MLLGVRLWARMRILLITESITQQKNAHLQFNTETCCWCRINNMCPSSCAGARTNDHTCRVCFTSPQISSFSVSPNYELLFFSSELSEVVSILDFFDGQEVNIKEKLEKFTIKGGSSRSETRFQ